jgi:tRNA(Ile)-lysidine synthase
MQQKVQTYIQKHRLLTPDGTIIVGVSGGIDSVVLLHLLISLGYSCVIAHCNFHLRMDESNRDEEFVRNLSHSYSIPFYHIDFDTIGYAEQHKISIEMAARDLRYAWFGDLTEKLDAQAVAIAHQADDSIETMLMNLVRGTGLRGLTGIFPRNNKVVRPLLCCTRSEIENYMLKNRLEYVEDSSNLKNEYQRNRFRNEILPLLIEINPSVRENLYRSIENLEGNLAIYEQAIEKIKELIIKKNKTTVKMDIELIQQQVHIPAVMFELLYPFDFHPSLIKEITDSLVGESGKIFYSDTHRLIKDRKYLIITPKEEIINEYYTINQTDEEIDFPIKLKINKRSVTHGFKISKQKNCIHVDASKLSFPLQIRHWKDGDWFFPFGMNNKKKISDFFIDSKLSLDQKEKSWLLVSGNDIVWIIGQRLDNRFRVNNETKEVVEITLSNS